MQLISKKYFKTYSEKCNETAFKNYKKIQINPVFSVEDFEFYIAASSVYSSKIEGNSLDINSFMRNRKLLKNQKEIKEIEDLVKAYRFASENEINIQNFLQAHKILSNVLLPAKQRGKIRKHQVGVYDSYTGKPVYVAVEPEFAEEELQKLFSDIAILLSKKLSVKEVFYFSSMIHLWLAKIHPFADGNGRSARLLEKWFLAQTTNKSAWAINSEKYYCDNRPDYYKNISLGLNYYALKWERCIPFLLMLPKSVIVKK